MIGLNQFFIYGIYFNLTYCVFIDAKQDIPDWKAYLMKKLVGANTLPVDFYLKVNLDPV